jgi:hypothetical protein
MVPLAKGQDFAARSYDIDALAWHGLPVRPLLGDLPEQLHVGRPWGLGLLIILHCIGRRNEVPRELLEERAGPDELSVE